jgi:hypothetical protein
MQHHLKYTQLVKEMFQHERRHDQLSAKNKENVLLHQYSINEAS